MPLPPLIAAAIASNKVVSTGHPQQSYADGARKAPPPPPPTCPPLRPAKQAASPQPGADQVAVKKAVSLTNASLALQSSSPSPADFSRRVSPQSGRYAPARPRRVRRPRTPRSSPPRSSSLSSSPVSSSPPVSFVLLSPPPLVPAPTSPRRPRRVRLRPPRRARRRRTRARRPLSRPQALGSRTFSARSEARPAAPSSAMRLLLLPWLRLPQLPRRSAAPDKAQLAAPLLPPLLLSQISRTRALQRRDPFGRALACLAGRWLQTRRDWRPRRRRPPRATFPRQGQPFSESAAYLYTVWRTR